MPFRKVAVAIITPTHTKKSFELGLEIAKKFDSELTVIECMYKTPPKFYFFETKSDKKLTQNQITKLKEELENWVRKEIGPIAKPDIIQWAPGLPKTRSGKIMRRILRKIAENDCDSLGDISTLADPSVVEDLIKNKVH